MFSKIFGRLAMCGSRQMHSFPCFGPTNNEPLLASPNALFLRQRIELAHPDAARTIKGRRFGAWRVLMFEIRTIPDMFTFFPDL